MGSHTAWPRMATLSCNVIIIIIIISYHVVVIIIIYIVTCIKYTIANTRRIVVIYYGMKIGT